MNRKVFAVLALVALGLLWALTPTTFVNNAQAQRVGTGSTEIVSNETAPVVRSVYF